LKIRFADAICSESDMAAPCAIALNTRRNLDDWHDAPATHAQGAASGRISGGARQCPERGRLR
jgi:hypothetical protein